MTKVFFKHTKTGKMYRVISVDKVNKTIKLKGEHAEFEEPYDVERFKKMGYELHKETD